MTSFWNQLPTPFFILAPMEAVTDVVFRHVVTSAAAPDVFFTEFTNATGWAAAGERAVGGRLDKTDDEHPLVAQLWGTDPEAMAKLASHCAEVGFDGIDLNTGCPDSSAVKGGAGAGLIKNPELTAKLIAAAKTSGLPVSVKTRLGYSSLDERTEWISFLLQQDIVALTVHLRTKKEMSKVEAHWEIMHELKDLRDAIAPSTKIIGNGDVRDRQHGLELIEKTGIDGIMIGRGVFTNPYCFEAVPKTHSREELVGLLRLQLDLFDTYNGKRARPYDPLKRFFKIYIRDFAGASELRDQLMQTKNTTSARKILDEHLTLAVNL
jgi:tRNA-dihydrouridine synthase